MFLCAAQIAHDPVEILCSFHRPEAAGDLLLDLCEADRALRFVVGKGNPPIKSKTKDLFLVVPEPNQKRPARALRLSRWATFDRLRRVQKDSLSHEGVIPLQIGLDKILRKRIQTRSFQFFPCAAHFGEQLFQS